MAEVGGRDVAGARRHRAGDLLGFKAHFRHARLPAGLMPLVLFPGGYGGMVNAGDGLTSFTTPGMYRGEASSSGRSVGIYGDE